MHRFFEPSMGAASLGGGLVFADALAVPLPVEVGNLTVATVIALLVWIIHSQAKAGIEKAETYSDQLQKIYEKTISDMSRVYDEQGRSYKEAAEVNRRLLDGLLERLPKPPKTRAKKESK